MFHNAAKILICRKKIILLLVFFVFFVTLQHQKVNNMKKLSCTSLYLLLMMMIPSMMSASPGSKKDDFKKLQQTMERLLTLANDPLKIPPSFLADDDEAYDYCLGILSRSDEDYSRDTLAANEWKRTYEWVLDHQITLPPKTAKKIKNYDEESLIRLYGLSRDMLNQFMPRYGELLKYCDVQLQNRREARQRHMPEGRLISLYYSESGSSRPDPVRYSLVRDSLSGTLTLKGYVIRMEEVTMAVGEDVAEKVCELIENHKIYQELEHYSRPRFRGHPELLGGPPSWYFSCKLEGGTISTEAEAIMPASGCAAIAAYLHKILEEEWKRNSQP